MTKKFKKTFSFASHMGRREFLQMSSLLVAAVTLIAAIVLHRFVLVRNYT